jgi:hypothetical protein
LSSRPSIDDILILLALGAAVAGSLGATVAFFTRDIRLKRRLRRTSPEDISTVREGRLVKIVGKLSPAGPPLASPVSGRPCVYFHVWYEALHTVIVQGARVLEWGPGLELTDVCDFLVTDGTGTALVRTREGGLPEVAIRADAYVHTVSEDGAQRSHEAILEAGDTVAVFGRSVREVDSRSEPVGYRDAPARLVLHGDADAHRPLIISDDPGVIGLKKAS